MALTNYLRDENKDLELKDNNDTNKNNYNNQAQLKPEFIEISDESVHEIEVL